MMSDALDIRLGFRLEQEPIISRNRQQEPDEEYGVRKTYMDTQYIHTLWTREFRMAPGK
jgi:hypothetical protein